MEENIITAEYTQEENVIQEEKASIKDDKALDKL